MATASDAPGMAGGSTEALRRVKLAEQEWEQKIAAARRAAEEATRRAREEAESAIHAARVAAEQQRNEGVARAREALSREVSVVEAEGARAAEDAGAGTLNAVRERKDSLLTAILGPLRGR